MPRRFLSLHDHTNWHRFFAIFLVLVLVVACSETQSPAVLPDDLAPSAIIQPKIGPGVLEAIQAEGHARIVIALVQPTALRALEVTTPSEGRSPVNLGALRREVAGLQREVLSRLPNRDFRSQRVFRNVPAFAGTVLTERGLNLLASHPRVVRIDLDVGGTGGLANSLPVIGADFRHGRSNTGTGVVVAVLDTGIDTDNDDFTGRLVHEACFLDDNGSLDGAGRCPDGSDRQTGAGAAEDDAGHGTHVTGIIASNGTNTSPGVAPDSNIVSVKVLAGPTFAGVFFFFSEIVAALDYIIDNDDLGIQVINMSLGTGALFDGECDNASATAMAGAAAINTLRANGVVAFASSGNNGSDSQMPLPACLSNVVSVGATDNNDSVAGFTNSNATTDIMAPGVNVVSSGIGDTTRTASGTSMASPHAAGCALLLIETGEAVTPDDIEARLKDSPVQVTDAKNDLTFPRIDCRPLNQAPVAGVGGPYSGDEGSPISFDGSSSSDPDGDDLTYEWDFGDGNTSTNVSPSHTYLDNGVYTVELTVTDLLGESDTNSTTATIANVVPTVDAGPNATIISGETFNFSGNFSDPGVIDFPWSYEINWNDGTTTNGSTNDQAAAINYSHQFCAARDYNIVLSVTDKDGDPGSDSMTLTVEHLAVSIDILPGSNVNPVNLGGRGRLPVAVLSTTDFDATTINPALVTLGNEAGNDTPVAQRPNGSYFGSVEDVNGDGLADLVLHFAVPSLVANGDLIATTTSLVLLGGLYDNCTQVRGVDVVQVVP